MTLALAFAPTFAFALASGVAAGSCEAEDEFALNAALALALAFAPSFAFDLSTGIAAGSCEAEGELARYRERLGELARARADRT